MVSLVITTAIALQLLPPVTTFSTIPIKSMQPTISIPQHWGYPRFALDQRTQDGIILGFYCYPSGTELAEQFGGGWRYALMPNKNSDELFHFQESQIKPLTPEELFSEITAEIEFYQQQIAIRQQQLAILTGGFTNG